MIEHIDSWIIGKFEAFSHWTQTNFGLDSVWWERVCLVVMITLMLKDLLEDHTIFRWVGIAFLIFSVIRLAVGRDKSPIMGSGSITANPEKYRSRTSRVLSFGLIVAVSPLYFMGLVPWYVFATFSYYFGACDDLPPGMSRLRKFINSLSASQTPVSVEG